MRGGEENTKTYRNNSRPTDNQKKIKEMDHGKLKVTIFIFGRRKKQISFGSVCVCGQWKKIGVMMMVN